MRALDAVVRRAGPGLVAAALAVVVLIGTTLWYLAEHRGDRPAVVPGYAVSGDYRLNCAQKPYSFKESTSPDGAVVRRHELRAGDTSPRDRRWTDGRQRCEIIGQVDLAFDTPIWFAYSFRQTGSMPDRWVTMTQFQTAAENGEPIAKPPAFAMRQERGRLELVSRSDRRRTTTTQVDDVVRHSLPWFPAGSWQHIVGRLVFDPFGDGSITLWVNGALEYASGPIPMGYNDAVGPHFSHGQYRGASDRTTVFEFANVEAGTVSLADRISAPHPVPD